MSFNIDMIQNPSVTHTFGSASNWLFSQNPMIWKFQRKDLQILSVTDLGGGETRLTFTSSPYWMTSGGYIWWGDLMNKNDGRYLVTGVDLASNSIDIALIYSGHVLGWVNDTTGIQNYHIFLEIYKWLGTGLQGDTIAYAKFYDDPKGVIMVDLREYLSAILSIGAFDYFGIATQHEMMDQDFSFTYRPGFVHATIIPEDMTPTIYDTRFWAIKGSAQLGDEFGQNARRYMSYPAVDPLDTDALMHFNTMFDEPYYELLGKGHSIS